jgi:hypothetical protein
MKNHLLLLILFSFLVVSCNKKEDKDNATLVIKAGFMCGWGSGQDSLVISSTRIQYVYYVPANSQIPEVNKARPTTPDEWNNILNSINFNNFSNLHYNSCNICVDGCDEWISIKDNSINHQIRFGLGLKIDSIKPLQDILAQLRTEFRN